METVLAPPPTKGRPREFCCEAALGAALRVFWSKGFDGASMADLTDAMGISKPSLYAAFGNKEALFHKALDLYEREKLAYVGQALEAQTARGVAERLLRGALAMQNSGNDPAGCLGVIASVACSAQAESIRADVTQRTASIHTALVDRFARACDEGDLPEGTDPEALARLLSSITQGMAVQASSGATPEQLSQLVDTALAIWPGR
ncbi:TetR/AcrR family transcriptional regulator [Sphingomonas montanisoli]|uniref:TetR/AcrR family transcriptional regulator n=1 Tax=Sphingomonas montanisoli TaxID=2606412 RepID=A0A5D9C7X5_9SPHN|nr:TetR/AcrR family transcriptional regulator [Sphingomonas montanisoli]TZG27978.1 TetR/AcrR family transcriptional regulator [Sphingomonas montanisoli]